MKNMIETFKKSFSVLVVGALMVGALPANAARPPVIPDGRGLNSVMPIEYVGTQRCVNNQTTAAKQCATGSGLLYELCAFGTAVVLGKGAMAFDSAVITSATGFQAVFEISPIVYGTAPVGATSDAAYMPRCWSPAGGPQRYENGLVVLSDDGSVSILARYRPDTGVNP